MSDASGANRGSLRAGELAEFDDTHTAVMHTRDWSVVTDPGVLARVSFPWVSAEAMIATVRRLEAAAS